MQQREGRGGSGVAVTDLFDEHSGEAGAGGACAVVDARADRAEHLKAVCWVKLCWGSNQLTE